MLRITKLADYGVILLSSFVTEADRQPLNARDLAEGTKLPLPTVSKILKALTREGLLTSHRGAKGGYRLAKDPEEISVAEIIRALEGPIAMTECLEADSGPCPQETLCPVSSNWRVINRAVMSALERIPLSEMVRSGPDFEEWLDTSESEAKETSGRWRASQTSCSQRGRGNEGSVKTPALAVRQPGSRETR